MFTMLLVSGVQQSELHVYMHFFFTFSIMLYHRILNIVHCAIQ